MNKQPSVIIIGYIVGVVVACAALASLTKVSLEMEKADFASRQEAALEENVRLALWRIDSDLAAMIGRESSWPYYAYSPAYSVGGTTVDAATPPQARITSPLADFTGNWVVARFQIAPDGTVTSPQAGRTVLLDDGPHSVESLLEDLRNPDIRATLGAALPDPEVPTLEAVSRVTRTMKSRGAAPPTATSAALDPPQQVKRNMTEFDTRSRFTSANSVPITRFEATRNLIQGFVSGWPTEFGPAKLSSWWLPPASQIELRSTPLLSSMSAPQTDTAGGYGPPLADELTGRFNAGNPNDYQSIGTGQSEVRTINPGNTFNNQSGSTLTLNAATISQQTGNLALGNATLNVNSDAQNVQILVAPSMLAYNSARGATINPNGATLNGAALPQAIPVQQTMTASPGVVGNWPVNSQTFTGTTNVNSAPFVINSNAEFGQPFNTLSRNAGSGEMVLGAYNNVNVVEEVRSGLGAVNSFQNGTVVSQGYGNAAGSVVNVGPMSIVGNSTAQQGAQFAINGNVQPQVNDYAGGVLANGVQPQWQSQLRAPSQFDVAGAPGQRLFGDNNLALQTEVVKVSSVTGVMAPVWHGGTLWLARKVDIDGLPYLQGCRLDWRGLRRYLQGLTFDLLPEVQFEAIVGETTVDAGRLLASIPAKIVPGSPAGLEAKLRPTSMRTTLAWAWGGLLTAAAAVALMLWKVTALSERRASFVSSVTHELRTPLTTFRLYGEMLASNMVADPEKRQEYLETMCAESERLSHLVENVLAYSRIERGRARGSLAEFTPDDVLTRCEARLRRRAEQAGMTFDVTISEGARGARLRTDPSAVEQILFNLVDNAGKYAVGGEPRKLELFADADARQVTFGVRDNGPGIGAADRKRLFQPFSKGAREAAESAPGVGLGLALCRRLARELGGDLRYLDGEIGATFVLALPCCIGPK